MLRWVLIRAAAQACAMAARVMAELRKAGRACCIAGLGLFIALAMAPIADSADAGSRSRPAANPMPSHSWFPTVFAGDGVEVEPRSYFFRDPETGRAYEATRALSEKIIVKYHAHEIWAGASVNAYGWSVYSGITIAPLGNDGVQKDGWRLRATTAFSWRGDPANVLQLPGVRSSSDVLIGYHKTLGPLIVKAFGGLSLNGEAMVEYAAGVDDLGGETGAIGAFETWLNLAPRLWLSTDGSWSNVQSSYSLGSRLGYRATPALSLGPEAAAYGNDDGAGGRLGAFLRAEWTSGELSVAGGVTGKNWTFDKQEKSAYGSLTWVHRF